METNSSEVPAFQFKNEGLSDRCKDVFGCLDALENKHKAFEKTRAEEDAEADRSLIRQGPSMEEAECLIQDTFKHPGRTFHTGRRGMTRHDTERNKQQGEFKIPNRPVRGRGSYRGRYGRGARSSPDYTIHPDRWTEYSLENVDISTSSMKQAAFDFLNEQRNQREDEQKEEAVKIDSIACSKGLISFKKPVKNRPVEKDKALEKKELLSSNQTVGMEEDEDQDCGDIVMDLNVEMKDGSVSEGDAIESKSIKRKIDTTDDMDNLDGMEEGTSNNVNTGFKCRKFSRKNIRSRRENDSDSE